MKISKSWETIVSVIILVVIISVVITSIIWIIEYDSNQSYQYDKINYVSVLEKNTNTLIKKINTSTLTENDIFYLYKTGSQIYTFTWTANQDYKYINYLWEYVNTWSYNWAIYARQCLLQKDAIEWQVIKCSIKELIKK